MKYGHFDDDLKEYIVETPATPLPWINYLGNEDFFSLISNTAGGYSFYRDAKIRRITRYRYNSVPADTGGRCYYIKEGDLLWSPAFLPCKTDLDSFCCRHGLGYTVFESSKNELSEQLTCFVPIGETCEVNQLILKNNSKMIKKIQVYGAVEWCLWDAVNDSQNFQRNLSIGEVEVKDNAVYHKSEYRERRNHYAYFSVNRSANGFDTDRDRFLGRFGSWDAPEMVLKGESGNSIASGWWPIACHRLDIALQPGEEKTLIFILGYVENPQEGKWESKNIINKTLAESQMARFADAPSVAAALKNLSDYWSEILKHFQIESDDHKLNRMVNIWNQYQCMVTLNMSRSASYYESGTGRGMGFRDSCQDILGFVHLVPERARARILDITAIQFEDGSTYHQYQPLTKRGNGDVGSGFNDDPLWLIACTAAYIRETGDSSILYEKIPFNNQDGSEQSLFEHLRRSIKYTMTHLGPHGLPLIGRADWNDCLNLNCFSEQPGESFQTVANFESGIAESVFIAAMFIKYGREYMDLCRHYGASEEADHLIGDVEKMKQAVLSHAWDGEWFLRAYDAIGSKVGSRECKEGKIFIEPQGFCVMAGIGVQEGLAERALSSVHEILTNDYGIEILSPCYTEYHKELGEITSYPPGYKENGSIFCHTNPWISIAETLVGNPQKAFDIYRRTCPAYNEIHSDVHRAEPYVYSQMIAGRNASRHGEAKNSWLTGTAAWAFVNISQAILGIFPGYDGLMIHPCAPRELERYKIIRWYRNAEYAITINNTGTGIPVMKVDGKTLAGQMIPYIKGKMKYEVEVFT